jgi:hypothetical protein
MSAPAELVQNPPASCIEWPEASVAIWGTTIIIAQTEKHPEATTASASIDVLNMMRYAKGLPEEQFDAH